MRYHNTFSSSLLSSRFTDLVQIGEYKEHQYTGRKTFVAEEENIPVIMMAIDATEIIQNMNSLPVADYKFIIDKKLDNGKVIFDGYTYYKVVSTSFTPNANTYLAFAKELTVDV
ncbi:hypothetical protein [Oceanotoga phage vB_OteS-UFV02]